MATINDYRLAIARCVQASELYRDVISKDDTAVINLEHKTIPSLAKVVKDHLNAMDYSSYHGKDAIGIDTMVITGEDLEVTLSDGSSFIAGSVVGHDAIGVDNITMTNGDLTVSEDDGTSNTFTGIVGTDGETTSTITIHPNGDVEFIDGTGASTIVGNISDLAGGQKIASAGLDSNGYLTIGFTDGTSTTINKDITGEPGEDGVYITTADLDLTSETIGMDLTDGTTLTVKNVPVINKPAADYEVASTEITDVNGERHLMFTDSNQNINDLGNIDGSDGTDGVDGTDSTYVKTIHYDDTNLALSFTLTDGTTLSAGNFSIENVAGDATVTNAYTGSTGALLLDLTINGNAYTLPCGKIVGKDGKDAVDGGSVTDAYIDQGVLHVVDDMNGDQALIHVDAVKIDKASISPKGVLTFSLTDPTLPDIEAGQTDGLNGQVGDVIISMSIDSDTNHMVLQSVLGATYDVGVVREPTQVQVDMVNSELIFTFADGSTANLGDIHGIDGVNGGLLTDIAINGTTLTFTFDTGSFDVTINGVNDALVDDATGNLNVTLSDGTTATFGPVRGTDGVDGKDGLDGYFPLDGAGIQSDRSLQFNMSDGTTLTFKDIEGYTGVDGAYPTAFRVDTVNKVKTLIAEMRQPDGSSKDLTVGPIDGTDAPYPTTITFANDQYTIDMSDGSQFIVPGVNGDNAQLIDTITIESGTREFVMTMADGTEYRPGVIDGADADYITAFSINADRELVASLDLAGDQIIGLIDGKPNVWLDTLTVDSNGDLIATLTDGTTQFNLGPTQGVDVTNVYLTPDLKIAADTSDGNTVTSTVSLDRTINSAGIDANDDLFIDVANQPTPIIAGNIPPGTDAVRIDSMYVASDRLKLERTDGTIDDLGPLKRTYVSGAYLTANRELVVQLSDGTETPPKAVLGADGRDVVDAYIDIDGTLVITMSDSEIIRPGIIKGDDGLSVSSSSIVNGELIFTMADTTQINAGFVDADFGFNPWDALDAPYDEGQTVTHMGDAYMAIRQTSQEPPGEDWMKVRAPGDAYDQRAPLLISPINGNVAEGEKPYLLGTKFGKFFSVDERLYRQFEIDVEGGDFSNPIYTANENFDGHQVTMALDPTKTYIWHARDVNASTGYVSIWSKTGTFTVPSAYIQTPSVASMVADTTQIDSVVGFIGSPYTRNGVSNSHIASDWVIRDADTQEVIYESLNDTTNLTKISIPFGILQVSRNYEVRLRYHGDDGHSSSWSSWLAFQTKDKFTFAIKPLLTYLGSDRNATPAEPRFRATFNDYEFIKDDLYGEPRATAQWQVTKVSDGSVVWETQSRFVEIEDMIVSESLTSGVQYEIHVRYSGGNYAGPSDWSDPVQFTPSYSIADPVLSTSYDVNAFPYAGGSFSVAPFSVTNEKIVSVDWEVVSIDTGEVLVGDYINFDKPTTFKFEVDGKTYGLTDAKVRVRFHGQYYTTPWAEMSFTFAEYVPIYVYSGSTDQTVKKIDPDGSEVWTFSGHTKTVNGVTVDYSGNVYSGSNDYAVKKIDPDGAEVWTFSGHTNNVMGVAVDSSGNVYSGSADNTVKKIDPNGSEVWTFNGHTNVVRSVAVDSSGNVYSGSYDQTVKKIDPDGSEVWTFSGHTNAVYSVAVDSSGNVYSGSGSADNTVKKIDPNGSEVWTFSGHTNIVMGVAVDSSGNVYSGSYDNTVKKIDPNGSEVWTFSGHTGYVRGVAVDSSGNVYSGSADNTVKKIDPDGNEVWTFSGHTSYVNSVACTKIQTELVKPVLIKSKYTA